MDVHGRSSLQRSITIRTPENLELSYLLAGAGSRMVAYLIDFAVMWMLLMLVQNLIAALLFPLMAYLPTSEAWLAGIVALLMFALINGYFIVFEWVMNGQTPGKRVVGIRVVKEGGYSLRFLDTLIRNLMRFVDFLPILYGVGLASMLLTPRSQRLGDLLAGTLLVHQSKPQADAGLQPVHLDRSPAELPPERLAAIPTEVTSAVAEYFEVIDELAPRYRQEIAAELVELVRQTSGIAPAATQSAEGFLGAIMSQSARNLQL